jgi:hypothetical protein
MEGSELLLQEQYKVGLPFPLAIPQNATTPNYTQKLNLGSLYRIVLIQYNFHTFKTIYWEMKTVLLYKYDHNTHTA